ncbi:MAG: hypothetical protein KC561_05440 [Myxococcales bacterium]|nr:hypothetical protein [Myxococcales bacterium]
MSQKKPIWTTTDAHARLKSYCKATGRTQLEVVSELILTLLNADGTKNASTEGGSGGSGSGGGGGESSGGGGKSGKTEESGKGGKPFGGVWVV